VSVFEPARSPWPDRMLSVLRIVAALLFILHGSQKIFGVPAGAQPPKPFELVTQTGVAGILEFFGGLAILAGVFTRPIAFVLAGEMAVAYFQVHYPRSFFPVLSGGDTPILFCFIFLFLAVAGAGVWSVDALIRRSRRNSASQPYR
jgi:putative oxidoreductase